MEQESSRAGETPKAPARREWAGKLSSLFHCGLLLNCSPDQMGRLMAFMFEKLEVYQKAEGAARHFLIPSRGRVRHVRLRFHQS